MNWLQAERKNYKRYLTAFILLPIVLALLFWGEPLHFALVVLIVQLAGVYELYAIMATKGIRPLKLQGYLYTVALTLSSVSGSSEWFAFLLICCLFTCFLERIFIRRELTQITVDLPATLFAVIYLGMLGSYIVLIRTFPGQYGAGLLAVYLAIIWLGDSGAYYFGKSLGNHKFAPVLSPNKTWEGFFGGLLTAIALGFVAKALFYPSFPWQHIIGAGLAVGAIGHLGDLYESMIKRSVKVKDSGTFFPGHGGALDRVDSLFFAAPFYYFYCQWIFG